jgi:serine/threonine protein phosphatase PrpC
MTQSTRSRPSRSPLRSCLVLYTDGISDAAHVEGEMGSSGLWQILRSTDGSARDLADAIITGALAEREAVDDMLVLTLMIDAG